MQVNIFSVRIQTDRIHELTSQYRTTMQAFANGIVGFEGMLGLVDDETGDALSVAVVDNEPDLVQARESDLNRAEVHRYSHLFVSEPSREAYKLELRYMPQNRPFPGNEAMYARSTTVLTRPRSINRVVKRSRDSLVFAAISEPGCAGFLLCSQRATGKIFGFSMWESLEYMLNSEGDSGYYHREMAKHDDLIIGPYERRVYRVFDRLIPGERS